ncbi:hypothetical protein NEMBOFW57_004370 [Staphylotrichum longicolle]|uniref:DUF7598 domain-containing protein n=1 Tax=Staphylotrichum longicolle TaxID=669026 RepID=A0AAD4F704_9PEZI|nr:hypothetical protein NEMBOFW57_004370 [Staphylotrichum longicolle]
MFNRKKVLGTGHVVLNVLRAFNLIGLAAVMLSSVAMPALSAVHHNFFFFDTMTHFFVFFFATFLFVSELPVPWKLIKGWYARCWPVLSQDHSLAWLGWGMVFIGFQPLGDYWKPGYSVDVIGQEWWRAILAASILCITFGFFNIIASMIFRLPASETENNVKVTSRQIRTHGSLALEHAVNKQLDDMEQSFVSQHSRRHRDNFSAHAWSGTKEEHVEPSSAVRRITHLFNPRNFRKSRIQISKPIPQDMDIERGHSSHSHLHAHPLSDDRASPILPDIQRPPTALHPAFTGGSRYSEAHMDRF